MKSSYTAHGKVILIGEHSVVYGYNALAMPIMALKIKTTVEPNKELLLNTAKVCCPLVEAPSEYDGLKYVVKTLLAKAKRPENLKITYTGEIPIERGLGSSATVALGTTMAMNYYFNLNLSQAEIMAVTNHAEMINHGKASGLDVAAVCSDDLVFFNKKTGTETLSQKLGATILIMDTGELGSTKQAVKLVHQQVEASQTAAAKIAKLGQLTDSVKQAWLNQEKTTVGQLFTKAEAILASFGLATDKINQLQKIALTNQALGFKLSGSGLGGIVIALCPNPKVAQLIAAKSNDLIANYWLEEI